MIRALTALLLLISVPAAAQVDPALVGMWQLQWVGAPILWQVRAECANGTNDDPAVRCVPGLGDVAFFYTDSVHDADAIALGRLALRKL